MDEFKLCAHDLRLQPGNLSRQRLGFLLGSRLQLFPRPVELCLFLLDYPLILSILLLTSAVFEVVGQWFSTITLSPTPGFETTVSPINEQS
jgi:hypothetical protein